MGKKHHKIPLTYQDIQRALKVCPKGFIARDKWKTKIFIRRLADHETVITISNKGKIEGLFNISECFPWYGHTPFFEVK